jgi:hypothetical protein
MITDITSLLFLLFGVIILVLSLTLCDYSENEVFFFSDQSSSPSVGFLIHTFDGYKRYWPGFFHFFQKYYPQLDWPIYFANESLDINIPFQNFSQIKTGVGEWGYRLLQALQTIPEKFILYMQEDMWLTAPLSSSYLNRAMKTMTKYDLNHLKLQKNCTHKIIKSFDVNNSLWYIVSHQPALWKKSYLISTLKANMTPFQHETETNIFLHQHPEMEMFCKCNQDFDSRIFPYEDVSRRGQLRDIGKRMLQTEGLNFVIGNDEIMYRGF